MLAIRRQTIALPDYAQIRLNQWFFIWGEKYGNFF
jgi:hypothetical protein